MATIKQKILVNVCIIILIVVGIVGRNYQNLAEMEEMQVAAHHRTDGALIGKEASMKGLSLYAAIADAVINHNLAETDKKWPAVKKDGLAGLEGALKVASSPTEKQEAEESLAAATKVIAIFEGELLPLLKSGSSDSAQISALDEQIDKLVQSIEINMDAFCVEMEKEMLAAEEEFASDVHQAIIESLLIGFIGILLQAGMAAWLLRQVLRPVRAMVARLKDMAEGEGDLTSRLDDSSDDEISEANGWFNKFMSKLQGVIGQVAANSSELAGAAGQLQVAAQQIATGAEELASQTATIATASEEMAATSEEIAGNCQQAAQSAKLASTAATEGAAIVQLTMSGMDAVAARVQGTAESIESLGARSEQIGAIIGTIEDIASQTNLLALNAAIEAARAGEQGRGFAVVADEVRALAERTTSSTKEISAVIKLVQAATDAAVQNMNASRSEVAVGSEHARHSGEALARIQEQITVVAGQMTQIATAAAQQTATSSEIATNITVATAGVNETAAAAHDSAAAVTVVNRLAGELHYQVGRFKF